MERKYNYYFIVSIVLLVFAAVLYLLNNSQARNIPERVNSAEIKNEDDPVGLEGLVQGKSAHNYDPNMLPADTPITAKKFVVNIGSVTFAAKNTILKKQMDMIIGKNDKVTGLGWYDKNSNSGALYAELNMSDFKTDNSTTDKYLFDSFEYSEIIVTGSITNLELSEGIVESTKIPLYVNINGIQKSIIFEANIDIRDNVLKASGKSEIMLSDFGIKPPSLHKLLDIDNRLKISFEIEGNRID